MLQFLLKFIGEQDDGKFYFITLVAMTTRLVLILCLKVNKSISSVS